MRGVFSGTLKKKLGLTLASAQEERGRVYRIAEPASRYRDSWERPERMAPGEVYEITIELFPVANLFCRGHHLRLDLSSSNFPHFDVNPNSGEAEGEWRRPRIARNRVFVEAARPSHILLPVIPRDATTGTNPP